MTTDASNVVPFERPPRREEPPALTHVELRLNDNDCSIELTAVDEAGDVVVLKYALQVVPLDFDLGRLREAWSRWRGHSAAAS